MSVTSVAQDAFPAFAGLNRVSYLGGDRYMPPAFPARAGVNLRQTCTSDDGTGLPRTNGGHAGGEEARQAKP